MVPAQFMARAVTVIANALPQSLHFCDELIARHAFEISVHGTVGWTKGRPVVADAACSISAVSPGAYGVRRQRRWVLRLASVGHS